MQAANGAVRPATPFSGKSATVRFRSVSHAVPSSRRGGRASLRVSAGWGDPVEFQKATISSCTPGAEGLFQVTVKVPDDVLASYARPGQYVQMKVGADSKPAFIAVASSPGSTKTTGTLEFLIKTNDGTAGQIVSLKKGDALEISKAQGRGFDLLSVSPPEAFPNILIFATGSGIAPIRALIEATDDKGGLSAGKRGGVRMWMGARTAGHLPYADRFGAWERSGVKVTPVFSQGQGGCYVQDAFAAGGGIKDPATTGAVIVGQKPMAEAITGMLMAAGVPKERILFNF